MATKITARFWCFISAINFSNTSPSNIEQIICVAISGQSDKHFTRIHYGSRVVITIVKCFIRLTTGHTASFRRLANFRRPRYRALLRSEGIERNRPKLQPNNYWAKVCCIMQMLPTVWPVKSSQMFIKIAPKWFHKK